MKQIPVLADSVHCTGCAACAAVCSKDALIMQYNDEGFLEPCINEELCAGCKKCESVCPALNLQKNNALEPEAFVCKASDAELLKKCSSGGVFPLLAEYVIEQGGRVCGATFTEELLLKHRIVSSRQELDALYGSKYVQSDTDGSYKKIRKLLDEGRMVLFCGTPCQVAGLNNFVGGQNEKLITCDLLCHGAPSPKLFQRYLKEEFSGKKISDYKFRDKINSGWTADENVYFSNGKFFHRNRDDSPWYKAFLPCWSSRKSCAGCNASSLPRQGDFTLGDAWGIEHLNPELYSSDGVSVVTVNNEKAKNLFEKIKDKFSICSDIPLDWLKTHGQPFEKPFKSPDIFRDRFFQFLKRKTFNDALSYTRRGAYDIAVMGVWYGWNYGSILTYYSLYNFLMEQGYLVLMIDNDKVYDKTSHSRKFSIKHYGDRISRRRPNEKLYELNDYVDTFILGADQVLHNNVLKYFKNTPLLAFTDDSKKRIMYASSFGHETDSNPLEMRSELKKLFERFDSIGLREQSGVNIMKKNYGIKDARTVLDSVFLSDVSFYEKIASESECREEEPFVLAYILDPSASTERTLKEIAAKKGLNLVLILDGNIFYSRKIKKNLGITCARENVQAQDFVWYFMNAQYVITDSFHGTCFSIIFKKQFVTLLNERRGAARFYDLLSPLKLSGRMLKSESELVAQVSLFENPVDWGGVYKILNRQIKDSREFLLAAVEKKKKHCIFSKKKGSFFSRLQTCFANAYSHIVRIKTVEDKVSSLSEKVSLLEKKLEKISETQVSLMMRKPMAEEISEFKQSEILKSYNRARVDIKNCGSKDNAVTVLNSYADDTSFSQPEWFANENGHGLVCRGISGRMTFEIKCIGDGELKLWLRGPDVRDSNGKRYPVWINHICLFVNGKSGLPEPKAVWHDEPFIYTQKVVDSEKLLIHTEWKVIF
ncbi:MAG: polysaccharide pyruvyl transferase family protein [Treponema sp.]|nr:polysaccharide pyruvyl transferase family protein [Treponema sp.]